MDPVIATGLIKLITLWLTARTKRRQEVRELLLPLIKKADLDPRLADNRGRREWVLEQLVEHHGFTESEGLALIIAGVKMWRKLSTRERNRVAIAVEPPATEPLPAADQPRPEP